MSGQSIRKLPTIILALIVPIIAVATALITLNATSDTTNASSGGTTVVIKNFQFSPNPIVVKASSALTVTNSDGTTHTLTADDKSFDTGNLDAGAKGTIKISAPGNYTYHCSIHNYMTGTIEAK
jgi:plastocyanin